MQYAFRNFSRQFAIGFAAVALAALVSACGGGGNAAPVSSGGEPLTPAPVSTLARLAQDCVDCGAVSATEYTPGAKAGVWSYTNSSSSAESVPVALQGLTGQDVTLMLTNDTANTVSYNAPAGMTQPSDLMVPSAAVALPPKRDAFNAGVADFNRDGWQQILDRAGPSQRLDTVQVAPYRANVVGETRDWNACEDYDYTNNVCQDADPWRRTQLVATQGTQDGRAVQVWVQTSELTAGKVTTAHALAIADAYARQNGIHDTVKDLGGAPWGAHNYEQELLPGSHLPIDIVLININPDGQPMGVVGYFWAANNFKKQYVPVSNEALALFVDTETLYLASNGQQWTLSTLAHEGMHMANFYRRAVSATTNRTFATWLEEMTAMMAEDFTTSRVTPGFNTNLDARLPYYLAAGSYNCPLTSFNSSAGVCFSYAVSGTFGAYLSRQLGAPFYRTLLASPESDSVRALDLAIRAHRPESSLPRELTRWQQSVAATLSLTESPAGLGYPANTQSGYELAALDLNSLRARQTFRYATSSVAPYGSYPWIRRAQAGVFQETVEVPTGTTLSVVIRSAN